MAAGCVFSQQYNPELCFLLFHTFVRGLVGHLAYGGNNLDDSAAESAARGTRFHLGALQAFEQGPIDFLRLAPKIGIAAKTTQYPLIQANQALALIRRCKAPARQTATHLKHPTQSSPLRSAACLCHSTDTFPITCFGQAPTQDQQAWHLRESNSTKRVPGKGRLEKIGAMDPPLTPERIQRRYPLLRNRGQGFLWMRCRMRLSETGVMPR